MSHHAAGFNSQDIYLIGIAQVAVILRDSSRVHADVIHLENRSLWQVQGRSALNIQIIAGIIRNCHCHTASVPQCG